MRYIKTREMYEAVKIVDHSAILAQKIRPKVAGRQDEEASADYMVEASDQVLTAGGTALKKMSHVAAFRGKKHLIGIRIKERTASQKKDEKWVRTSATTGRDEIRTGKNRSLRIEHAEQRVGEERARGTAMAKKAYSAHKKAAHDGKVTAARFKARILKMFRHTLATINRQNVMIVGGGALAMFLVAVISMVGMIASSPFGLFFSIEEDGGASIRSVISELSSEFYQQIQDIQRSTPYDILEMKSDNGMYGVQWDDILPVWAVYRSAGSGKDVVEVGEDSKEQLRKMMKNLTSFSYEVTVTEIPAEKEDEEDDEDNEEAVEVQEIRTLTIRVRHGNIDRYTDQLGFTDKQIRLLNEIRSERYSSFWAKTVGAYSAGGQILTPYGAESGILTWPMAIHGSITSGFGYRTDPFTGEQKFHGGIDIGALQGTPILASADGTIAVANGTDPWGGGYGYYVMVSHGNGLETLYGHCSAVCVISGQSVQRGEVIAYVGSTGNSTGNHLHFEIRISGEKIDPSMLM
ncbi:MAG: M23 family metallopeptidase [Oscillospiraceae bacterium]|nr:M23 family metallopeptidase [Oscillospiraceae bacterium]